MKFGRNVFQVNTQYTSIDGIGFLIWRHSFKTATMT